MRAWFTPDGDGLGLFFFDRPPDLPPDAGTIGEIAAFYRERGGTAALVEIAGVKLDGCSGLRLINKVPQEHSGVTYVGSLTIPFRDFSFVLKVQCEERGATGLREAVLLDEALASGGSRTLDHEGRLHVPGWNPDDRAHDARFPGHPLSRARRALAGLERSIAVAAEVRVLPRFPLPPVASGG